MLLPPDELTSLTLDTQPAHALAALLCQQADAACGAETNRWRLTAEQRFRELEARAEERAPPTRAQMRAACEAGVDSMPAEQRLGRWLECIDGARDTRAALPLGRFRAPTTGWIVRTFRRGARQFCDELRAYDLATGAAYIASSCGRSVLTEDGSHVERDATDRTRQLSFAAGQVPVEALREAALITMVASSSEEAVADEVTREQLPANVPLEWGNGIQMRAGNRCGGAPPTWEWVDDRRSIAGGISAGAASEYTDELWDAIDARLAPGCPLAALPVSITPAPRPGETLGWTFDDLASALITRAASLACPATRAAARP
jgi:hypothetical protein